MGCCYSSPEHEKLIFNDKKSNPVHKKNTLRSSMQQPRSLGEVQEALRKKGIETAKLILGLDYTKSNTWNGQFTFGGENLHKIDIENKLLNPYQEVITIVGKTLSVFDRDNLIPVYGFGDVSTKDKSVFPFYPDGNICCGVDAVLDRYKEVTPNVVLSGPTSFAPIINEAISIVQKTKKYHILVIIADGQVDNVQETSAAIVEASSNPLSIIVVGVGDGPWDLMIQFDNQIPQRKFDNFRFVSFSEIMKNAQNRENTFSVEALQGIPEQYTAIKKLGLL